MNNTSMFTADRMTHLKIVVVSLVCATLVAASASPRASATLPANGRLEATVIKAGAPMTAIERDQLRPLTPSICVITSKQTVGARRRLSCAALFASFGRAIRRIARHSAAAVPAAPGGSAAAGRNVEVEEC